VNDSEVGAGDTPRRPLALVVDDEPSLVELVRLGLSYEGFDVIAATDGDEALRQVRERSPDVVILDIMLPSLDGFSVCHQIRQHRDVPLIMLTARDGVEDRVRGLNLGADDYLAKPFRFEELLARVRAVLRRKMPTFGTMIQHGDLRLNVDTREAYRAGRLLALTPREFDLLRLLLEHPGQVFSKETILNRVWGYDFVGDPNLVEVHISALRGKLQDQPPLLIRTLRGVGYRFTRTT